MSIPRWLADERHTTCLSCVDKATCKVQYLILQDAPACPLGKLLNKSDAIAARAWPAGALEPSDCCGSAENYRR
jgi:hypothetical protein